eukprot:EG_transcript_29826
MAPPSLRLAPGWCFSRTSVPSLDLLSPPFRLVVRRGRLGPGQEPAPCRAAGGAGWAGGQAGGAVCIVACVHGNVCARPRMCPATWVHGHASRGAQAALAKSQLHLSALNLRCC